MNKKIRIKICPIKRLYMIAKNDELENTGAILCSSYSINADKVKNVQYKLCLEFDDIINASSISAFNLQLAEQIKTFIDSVHNKVDVLYVCCDSGESRSTALSAAIMRYLGQNDKKIWTNPHYHPNLLVYKIQCKAFGIYVSKVELYIRLKISDWALHKAMRGK